jgi:hypothetical protein
MLVFEDRKGQFTLSRAIMLQHAHLHPEPSDASIQLATERAIGTSTKNGVGLERLLAIGKCLWLHLMHEAFSGADVEVFKWPDAWQPRSQQMQLTCM